MPGKAWSASFTMAVGAFRTALRHFPEPLVESPSVAQALLQPVANNFFFPTPLLPPDVTVKSDTVRGVRGEWFLPQRGGKGKELLVWAHGGGFAFCSPGTHRFYLARLCAYARTPVFCVDYRKPPLCPFPAPVEDVLEVVRALRADEGKRLFLGGDSAGGNIAIAATKALLQQPEEDPPPEGVVLLSPWVDLSDVSSESWQSELDYIPCNLAQVVARHYAGDLPLADERLSPALSESWAGFPRTLLEYAQEERFKGQIERLRAAMQRAGARLESHAEPGQVHGYPLWEFAWGWGEGPFEEHRERVAAFLRR